MAALPSLPLPSLPTIDADEAGMLGAQGSAAANTGGAPPSQLAASRRRSVCSWLGAPRSGEGSGATARPAASLCARSHAQVIFEVAPADANTQVTAEAHGPDKQQSS